MRVSDSVNVIESLTIPANFCVKFSDTLNACLISVELPVDVLCVFVCTILYCSFPPPIGYWMGFGPLFVEDGSFWNRQSGVSDGNELSDV